MKIFFLVSMMIFLSGVYCTQDGNPVKLDINCKSWGSVEEVWNKCVNFCTDNGARLGYCFGVACHCLYY
uniref:U13-buthitoxin-Hj1a n=1 Tax=Hottentotta judaicus TaxID=6863 RepID=F1CIZ1_HOTJU|nr:U13-buthitoxin-Hj1a [Hottentotta judaicus]